MAPVTRSQTKKTRENPISVYTFNKPRPQACSLPFNYSGYIMKNSTAQAYKNLIPTCKLVFHENRFIFADTIMTWSSGITVIAVPKHFKISWSQLKSFKNKFCISDEIFFDVPNYTKCASEMLNYIWCFDGTLICLNKQELTFNEYLILMKFSKNVS